MGRHPIGKRAMTGAERMAKLRKRTAAGIASLKAEIAQLKTQLARRKPRRKPKT